MNYHIGEMANNRKNSMLTTSGVAHILNVHVNTVRRWSDDGLLEVYRIGPRGDRRFKQGDIDRFLSESYNACNNKGLDKMALVVNTR